MGLTIFPQERRSFPFGSGLEGTRGYLHFGKNIDNGTLVLQGMLEVILYTASIHRGRNKSPEGLQFLPQICKTGQIVTHVPPPD